MISMNSNSELAFVNNMNYHDNFLIYKIIKKTLTKSARKIRFLYEMEDFGPLQHYINHTKFCFQTLRQEKLENASTFIENQLINKNYHLDNEIANYLNEIKKFLTDYRSTIKALKKNE